MMIMMARSLKGWLEVEIKVVEEDKDVEKVLDEIYFDKEREKLFERLLQSDIYS